MNIIMKIMAEFVKCNNSKIYECECTETIKVPSSLGDHITFISKI